MTMSTNLAHFERMIAEGTIRLGNGQHRRATVLS